MGTGIAIAIPKGYYRQIKPRSSLTLARITVDGGVIDSDYRGEVMVIMANMTPKEFSLEKNSQIVQINFLPVVQPRWKEVQRLLPSQRGVQGFGSTGSINILKAEITNVKHEELKDRHCYRMEPTLTKGQATEIRRLMREYDDILAIKHSDLPAETIIKHKIDTGDHQLLRQ